MTFKVIRGQGEGHQAAKFAKMTIFKVYLLRHLWSEVGFDDGLWIFGTICHITQAGFFTFGIVFDLWDFEFGEQSNFAPSLTG